METTTNHNQVVITGFVGKAAEFKPASLTGRTHDALTTFSLAHNRYAKISREDGSEGYTKTSTHWFRCVAWQDLAHEAKHLATGDKVTVYGRLETRQWQDKVSGQTISGVEVVALKIVVVSTKAEAVAQKATPTPPETAPVVFDQEYLESLASAEPPVEEEQGEERQEIAAPQPKAKAPAKGKRGIVRK